MQFVEYEPFEDAGFKVLTDVVMKNLSSGM
jgi:hypothetical protein